MPQERLDRQLRIEGWDQVALETATVGVVGDDDLLASLYIMSAAALGINRVVSLATALDPILSRVAEKLNPRFALTNVEGFYTHPSLGEIFKSCHLIVDLTHYGLANKLLLEKGYREGMPVIRGLCSEQDDNQGLLVFTYSRGREWQELDRVVSPRNLPGAHFDDGVLDIIVAGIALEETKNILMGREVSDALISYGRSRLNPLDKQPEILVVGSGALGNFVGLGLAYSGLRQITFMDPDVAEVTNLNRQILLYDALGANKAEALSGRLNGLFTMDSSARAEYFSAGTDVTSYDVVFDCVDNFETKIELSEKCKDSGKILISGGTSAEGGQAVIYDPQRARSTPAELLGLNEIVRERGEEPLPRAKASCTYEPDPSVIMTNQIIAGFMVDAYRMLLAGHDPGNVFYDSNRSERIQA
jgi:molybdopterin/thiamine biosynthesis adenylyltransferase